MADGLDIDRLSIEIDGTSTNAVKSIDSLISSLEKLSGVNVNVKGLTSLTNSITKINSAVSSLQGGQFSYTIQSISNSLNGLKGIDKSIATTINALTRFGKSADSLKSVNISQFTTQISGLANALKPLADVGKINLGSSLNQLKKLPLTIEELDKADLNKFAVQMQRVSSAISPLATKSAHISTIFSRLPGIFKNAGNQLDNYALKANKASKSHKGLYSSIRSLVGIYYTLNMAFGIVSNAFGTVFEESSQYIENLNLFNVAMGSATESATEFANKVNEAMGIDPSEWMKYQGSLNMMVTGFGVASDKAQIMSQNLTQLAYDYSSLMNVDVETAFDKINSAMSGQIKGLKEFGNNVSVAMVKETGLKYGLDGAVSSWDQNTQAIMRYITIMNNASKVNVFNDMARTINTPANAVRILTQQFTMLKRAIGNIANVLATAVIPYIQVFVQILTKAANFVANLFGFELPKIDYSGLAGGGTALDDVEDSANGASGAVDKANDSVKKLKKQLMGFDELNIINKPDDSSKAGGGAGSSGGVGGGGSIGDIELPQYDFLKGLENSTNEMLNRIEEKMKYLFRPISDSWNKYGNAVVNSFKAKWQEIEILIKSIGKSFNEVWQNGTGEKTVDYIFGIISNINLSIGNIARNFRIAWDEANSGTKIIQNIWDTLNIVLETIKDVSSEFNYFTKKLNFKPMIKSIEELTSSFKDLVKPISGILKDAWKNVLQPLAKWTLEKGLPSLITSVSKAFKAFGKIIDSLRPYISMLGKLASALLQVGGNAIVKAIDLLASAFDFLGNIFKTFPSLSNGVFTALTILYGALKVEKILSTSKAFNELINVVSILGGLLTKNIGFSDVFSQFKSGHVIIEKLATAIGGLNSTTGILSGVSGAFTTLATKVSGAGVAGSALSSIFGFMASNPLVAVAGGIALVTGAVIALLSSFDNQSEKMKEIIERSEELTEESKALKEAQSQLNESAKSGMDSQLGKYAIIKQYATELIGLGKGNVSEIGNAQTKVDELNSYCGKTVVDIRNGKLAWTENTSEVLKNVEAMKIRAMISANEEAYGQALLKNGEVVSNFTTAELNLKDAQSQFNNKVQEYVDRGVSYDDALTMATLRNGDLKSAIEKCEEAYDSTSSAMVENQLGLDRQSAYETQSKSATDENTISVEELVRAYTVLSGEYDSQIGKGQEVTSSWDTLSKKLNDYNQVIDGHGDRFQTMTDKEKKNATEAKSTVIKMMAEKAVYSSKTYDEMTADLGSSWNRMTQKEKDELNKQYKNLVQNDKSEGAQMLRQNQTLIGYLKKYHIDENSEKGKQYASSLKNAQSQGTKEGEKYLNSLSSELLNKSKEPKLSVNNEKAIKDVGSLQTKINNLKGKDVTIKFKSSPTGFDIDGKRINIKPYATGGIPSVGETFIAREKGPELVGRLGRKNAVMNNNQIVDAVSSGVYNAVLPLMGGGKSSGDITINATFEMDKEVFAKQFIKYHNGQVIQTGESPLNI